MNVSESPQASGWAKLLLVLGSIMTIALVAYSSWTLNEFVFANDTPIVANAPATTVEPAVVGATKQGVVVPLASWSAIQSDLAVLQKYSALVEYMKIFIPAFSFFLFSGLIGIGYYFVSSQVAKAQYESYKEANDKVARAAIDLDAAKVNFEKLESKLSSLLEHRLDVAIFAVDHAIGLIYWERSMPADAAYYEERCLQRIALCLARKEHLSEEQLGGLRDWIATTESTLAYYLVAAWRTTKLGDGAEKAIAFARRLPANIPFADERDIVDLVDNYLYVLALSEQPLLGSDKRQFVAWFNEYGDKIKINRTRPDAKAEARIELEKMEKLFNDLRHSEGQDPSSKTQTSL